MLFPSARRPAPGAKPRPVGADACHECALRLLDRRAHSEYELRTKLRQRQYPAPVITEVVANLRRLKLVDDLVFARLLIEQKQQAGAGRMKLLMELRKRGVPQELVPQLEEEFFAGDSLQEDEVARAAELLARKLRGARRSTVPALRKADGNAMQAKQEARKRDLGLLRFLAARGFSMSVARQALEQVQRAGAE